MALIWMEGFDHYGGDYNNMLDGAWGEIQTGWTLDSSIKRTGTYSLKLAAGSAETMVRRVLGNSYTTIGVGFALYIDSLPAVSYYCHLVELRDNGNAPNLTLSLASTGDLEVYRGIAEPGYGTLLASTSDAPIVTGAFQHVELQATIDGSAGAVEVRVNGVTVLTVSGVDTVAGAGENRVPSIAANDNVSQLAFSGRNDWAQAEDIITHTTYFDDIYVYDMTGSFNNTWLGDRRIYTLFPSADTVDAGWTPLSGDGYTNIDEGVDDDTSYISAGVPGSPDETSSTFELDNIPETVGLVSAVETVHLVKKTEAGLADVRSGIVSNGSTSEGSIHPLNTIYTYHSDVFEFDPDTGASFTLSAIDALQLKITRVT